MRERHLLAGERSKHWVLRMVNQLTKFLFGTLKLAWGIAICTQCIPGGKQRQ